MVDGRARRPPPLDGRLPPFDQKIGTGKKKRLSKRERKKLEFEAAERHVAKLAARTAAAKKCVLFGCLPLTVLGFVLLIVFLTGGCGGESCSERGICSGGLIAECACDHPFAGESCEGSCNEVDAEASTLSGTSACNCTGAFIGDFCDTECDCSGNGEQTAIEAARQAGACSAGSCACSGLYVGRFCETECACTGHGNQTNLTQARAAGSCSAGRCTCDSNWVGEYCEIRTVRLLNRFSGSPAGLGGATCRSVERRIPSTKAECEDGAAMSTAVLAGQPAPVAVVSAWGNEDCWGQSYPRCALLSGTLNWAEPCGDNPHIGHPSSPSGSSPGASASASTGNIEVICV